MKEDRRGHSPQSVTRVIQILEALCAHPKPLSLGDLSRAIGAPKSSMASLLRGLADGDLVASTPEGFRLGSRAFGLAAALLEARRGLQSSDIIREGMRKLATLTNETAVFGVFDKASYTITYVEVIESKNAVRFSVGIGDRRELYCTAGGRALLSVQPDDFIAAYFRQLKPKKITADTEVDKQRLANAIAQAREAGVACTVDQGADGASGVGAPVYDATGKPVGALVVIMPSWRLADKIDELKRSVAEEAERISLSLGHRA